MNDRPVVITDIIYNKVLDPIVHVAYAKLDDESLYFCTCRVNGVKYYQYVTVTKEFEKAKDVSISLEEFLITMTIRSAKKHYQKDQSKEVIDE